MACDKIVGYTDFTAQQSISGMPTPEADLTHDIEGVDDCGKAGILMGQSSYNLVQQDLRDGIIRMPTLFSLQQRWGDIYGQDATRWPNELRDTLSKVEKIMPKCDATALEPFRGFYRYDALKNDCYDRLVFVLQNLRLYEETFPAHEAGMAVVDLYNK